MQLFALLTQFTYLDGYAAFAIYSYCRKKFKWRRLKLVPEDEVATAKPVRKVGFCIWGPSVPKNVCFKLASRNKRSRFFFSNLVNLGRVYTLQIF